MYGIGYVTVSIVMWILARFSPYEWDNPYPCIEEPEELENQVKIFFYIFIKSSSFNLL